MREALLLLWGSLTGAQECLRISLKPPYGLGLFKQSLYWQRSDDLLPVVSIGMLNVHIFCFHEQ